MLKSLLEIDKQISEKLRLPQRQHGLWWPAVFFAHSGDSWFWMMALGLIWLFAPGEWHAWSAMFSVCIVIQALVVFAIKFSIRRARPEGEWGAIYRNTDPHSFPSGHATRSYLLVVLSIGLGPAWLAWILFFWAPLVCLARVATGVHYLSDVLAGAALGLVFGILLLQTQPLLQSILPFLFEPFLFFPIQLFG